jgi:outer membrane lipoprotein SlyB
MKTKWISLFLIFTLAGFTGSCATVEEHQGAAVGAGAGAATGAAAGALFGKSTGAAVVGGLLGALAGGAIGHYAYDQKRTGEQTAKEYNYQSSQGPVLRIESVYSTPQSISPGEEVQLSMTYAVLTPSPGS